MTRSPIAAVLLAIAHVGAAAAQSRPSDEPTAVDVAGAARPGQESGLAESPDPGDSTARRIARGALVLPRVALDTALLPVQLGVGLVERYQIVERAKRLFFNDAETIGLFPVARLESAFGVTLGARFVHRDVFGRGAKLGLQAGAGGRFRQLHRASFKTGELLGGRFTLDLETRYERRPREAFYGVGNTMNVESRYRHRLARATLVAGVRLAGDLETRISGALTDHEVSAPASEPRIDEMYRVADLPGYGDSSDGYGEIELRWDSRRRASRWEPAAIPAAGSLAAVYVGRTASIADAAELWRGGFDVQHFVRLAAGPRVLVFRAHGEAISAARDRVAFFELPRLGGATYLRGYPGDRFRDRAAVVGSIDYQWDLSRNVSATLFADAGRVYADLRDLTLDGMRVGYGAGLQLNTDASFLARASVASSIDGGVFIDFALDPVFELDRRVERR